MTAAEELIERRKRKRVLEEQVQPLMEEVRRLKGHVAKDSHKSSLPPSSDRLSRQNTTRSVRHTSGKKPGGQPGHQGQALQMRVEPTEIIQLPPVTQCSHCHADVSSVVVKTLEHRQRIDVPPPPPLEVKHSDGEWKACPHCQHLTHATFPTEISAAVQDGPRLAALCVSLMTQHLVPRRHTKDVLLDLLGVQLSEGTLTTVLTRAAEYLTPIEAQITTALSRGNVIHQDETGLDVMGMRLWVHVTSTRRLTHDQVHASRGQEALDEMGIVAEFLGTSVHDGWASSFLSHCQHALCVMHILRHLKPREEDLGLRWAHRVRLLLVEGKGLADRAREHGLHTRDPALISSWNVRFLALLDEGDRLHPPILTPKGKRGQAKHHPAYHLLRRVRTHQQAVWACLEDLAVPFDKNLAEQDVRMMNVQQKVSGTFRSPDGAVAFARIPGSLSPMRTQGQQMYAALEATVRGHPLLPSFSGDLTSYKKSSSSLVIARGAGSWSERIPGSTARVGFLSVGRRKSRMTWLFFMWLVLNSFFTTFWFSDKLLVSPKRSLAWLLRTSQIRCGPARVGKLVEKKASLPVIFMTRKSKPSSAAVTERGDVRDQTAHRCSFDEKVRWAR